MSKVFESFNNIKVLAGFVLHKKLFRVIASYQNVDNRESTFVIIPVSAMPRD